ncbi:hypothetical protein IV75_GL000901 [Carnobacterium maltaromaticum]|uniref:hypothetical protein n=1 Tax=Carnobacterium maltaromaticum TaxID=2751 RepID=UPI0007049130|nr:hypothetical protein [Carnobacterium maltaromaticum]KRN84192.1 hypothetical protein IV75_GL000901 [Carnobacterium maltaromaticum]
MSEGIDLKSIDINKWQAYLIECMGISVEEASAAMNRLMQGMSIANGRAETFRDLISVDGHRSGSKRNGTLDRREAFGNMLKRNKKGW